MEKRAHSCTVGGNVNCYSHYGEQYRDSLKKLRLKLPSDPTMPLLGKSSPLYLIFASLVQILPLNVEA